MMNQWWHGAAADLIRIPRVRRVRAEVCKKELVGVVVIRSAPRRRTLDPKDWAKKYVVIAVEIVCLGSEERNRRNSIIFSSNMHQAIGQFVLDRVARTDRGSEKKSRVVNGILVFVGAVICRA